MSAPATRASLLQRALGVFVLLAIFLALFLWAGRSLVPRPVEGVYLDQRRLAGLRTFERAILPLKSLPGYAAPDAGLIAKQFAFCADPLQGPAGEETQSARARSANPCANANAAEELACQLGTINTRLDAMRGERGKNRAGLLGERYVVSVEHWTEAILAAEGAVTCREAAGAARQLAARDGRLMKLFAWRELSSKRVAASQFGPGQSVKVPARILTQRNPWGGVPGCIYYGGANDRGAAQARLMFVTDRRQNNRAACVAMRPKETAEKDMAGVVQRTANEKAQDGDAAPESLDVILADLDNIRLPWKDLFRAYTETQAPSGSLEAPVPVAVSHGPNPLARGKHSVEAGFNVHLTIDPLAQRLVQDMSACYAGDTETCKRIGLASDRKFADFSAQMYEKAAVRMAAVALIDIPSGRIEALGSAHTDCYRQEYDGPGRHPTACPDLPTTPHYEPDRLLNHALFTDALPGSIVKPIMATGFLHDPAYRKKILAERVSPAFLRLQDELKSSDSVAFLNRMFCIDKGWAHCERPKDIQLAAHLFGWDSGCVEPSFRCGRLNVLFGYPDNARVRKDTTRMPLGASVMYGRLLTEPASVKRSADLQLMRDFSFDPALAAACSRGDFYSGSGPNRGWRKCTRGHLVYLESEGWGQGNARTTALGAAGMMARLAAAANGQASQRLPYLVERISDAQARKFDLAAEQFHLADPVKIEIPQEHAALITQGMLSHKAYGTPAGSRSGTAHAACIRVFDAATCNRIDWLAGKTGTPPYGNDGLTLKAIRQKCAVVPARSSAEILTACSREQPYKWYVAVFKTDDAQAGFNKAIAVLSERNWYRSGPLAGKVHSPGDLEMNVSAEMAFRIMARMRPAAAAGNAQAAMPSGGKS